MCGYKEVHKVMLLVPYLEIPNLFLFLLSFFVETGGLVNNTDCVHCQKNSGYNCRV